MENRYGYGESPFSQRVEPDVEGESQNKKPRTWVQELNYPPTPTQSPYSSFHQLDTSLRPSSPWFSESFLPPTSPYTSSSTTTSMTTEQRITPLKRGRDPTGADIATQNPPLYGHPQAPKEVHTRNQYPFSPFTQYPPIHPHPFPQRPVYSPSPFYPNYAVEQPSLNYGDVMFNSTPSLVGSYTPAQNDRSFTPPPSVAEPKGLFMIREPLRGTQRRSYQNENRYLNPNPVITLRNSNTGQVKVASGFVSVELVDEHGKEITGDNTKMMGSEEGGERKHN
eukprot:TRINITY_DN3165_c0_g1_i4.p1 TRINITY_DN3165_c0_g1~~TRINITY_DN3165_c0_g1_i4.p1  ORF type:complete len:280 (+),score=64.18 TRINITY_DN3165_c0_g1_i4:117-956(+)